MKTAIIGVGFIGAAHIEALRRLGGIDVVAVADPVDAEKKARALFVPKAYADYKTMTDMEKPDVIHVCTPNETHCEVSMYAIERGVHVLCEKPLAVDARQAGNMARAAREKGVVCGVNYINRFYPMAFQMRERIREGRLGRIFSIHGSYLQDWLFYDTDYSWRLESKVSGKTRAASDIGSHWMDLCEFVTGQKITEVCAEFTAFHPTRKKPKKTIETFSNMLLTPEDYTEIPIDTEDYASLLFRTDGGAMGSAVISQCFAGRKNQLTLAVSGNKSSLYWDSEDACRLWTGYRDRPNELWEKDPAILSSNTRKWTNFPGGHIEGYPDAIKQAFRGFYQAVTEGGAGSYDFADFAAGARQMVLCEALMQSAQERKWIEVGGLK
jgi:predicted dehydrogenase